MKFKTKGVKKYNLSILLLFLVFFLSGCGIFDFLDAEMNKAIEKKNPKLCLKMTEDMARKERCLTAVAEAKEDAQVCDMIDSENEKDKCFSGVAVKTEDAKICESISGEGRKSTCYNSIAINSQNEALCEKIPSSRTQGNCYKDIAIKKNDEGICAKIKDTFSGPRCYIEIAGAKKDTSICKKIEGRASHVSECLTKVAEQTEDESICASIETASYRDNCFLALGEKKQDSSLCDKISTERKKESCYTKLGIDDIDLEKELEDEYLDQEIMDELQDETTKAGVNIVDGKLYINSAPGEVLEITSSDLPSWASAQMVVVGAQAVCVGPPSSISSGDSNVLLNGLPVARINDKTSHGGTITVGSDKIFINGVAAAFVGANTVCPMVTGTVPHVGGPISNNGY